ncbi:hypothetical protein RF11_14876 [Thelohanellus kitauei]|uniref:Uncharacterized protein n=1 Tax=Thelohanellus kitauei TaxID=669202 RepID=A0A0C2I678_THEKT|nr:hypothetical protein RF11_14876 [Thelohanellus kitauei]
MKDLLKGFYCKTIETLKQANNEYENNHNASLMNEHERNAQPSFVLDVDKYGLIFNESMLHFESVIKVQNLIKVNFNLKQMQKQIFEESFKYIWNQHKDLFSMIPKTFEGTDFHLNTELKLQKIDETTPVIVEELLTHLIDIHNAKINENKINIHKYTIQNDDTLYDISVSRSQSAKVKSNKDAKPKNLNFNYSDTAEEKFITPSNVETLSISVGSGCDDIENNLYSQYHNGKINFIGFNIEDMGHDLKVGDKVRLMYFVEKRYACEVEIQQTKKICTIYFSICDKTVIASTKYLRDVVSDRMDFNDIIIGGLNIIFKLMNQSLERGNTIAVIELRVPGYWIVLNALQRQGYSLWKQVFIPTASNEFGIRSNAVSLPEIERISVDDEGKVYEDLLDYCIGEFEWWRRNKKNLRLGYINGLKDVICLE